MWVNLVHLFSLRYTSCHMLSWREFCSTIISCHHLRIRPETMYGAFLGYRVENVEILNPQRLCYDRLLADTKIPHFDQEA